MVQREIKFRAWDNIQKKMINTVDVLHTGEIAFSKGLKVIKGKPNNYLKLMQFTGMKDRVGNYIYEGDIIKNDLDAVGEVKYNKKSCCFYWLDEENNVDDWVEDIEVIGNIYENPELLSGGSS